MRTVTILALMTILTMVSIIGCSSTNKTSETVTSNVKTQEEAKFTEEELSDFKKSYSQLGILKYRDLEYKYEKVSDEEKSKVKENFERLKVEREEAVKEQQKNEKIKEEQKKKNEKEEVTKVNETPKRENVIGTSNKDFSSISSERPHSVINDKTGNWKLSRVSTSENILEYGVSYYKNNFNNDREIHAIVNFTLKTTTKVSKVLDNVLVVTIHEHVDKEELDANKLFTGMVLNEYWIYIDNGDIQKIK